MEKAVEGCVGQLAPEVSLGRREECDVEKDVELNLLLKSVFNSFIVLRWLSLEDRCHGDHQAALQSGRRNAE